MGSASIREAKAKVHIPIPVDSSRVERRYCNRLPGPASILNTSRDYG